MRSVETDKLLKVFISWSGDRSHTLAMALRRWLKMVVQPIEPWVSAKDIAPGQRWAQVLGRELEQSSFGIICVTSENSSAPWLLFESGVLGRSFDAGRVVPILLGIEPSQLQGPLGQFQSVPATSEGFRKLVFTLHEVAGTSISETELSQVFDALWPHLEREIEAISANQAQEATAPVRSDRDLLEEIIVAVRGLRVTPDEEAILQWIEVLASQAESELGYLEEREHELTEQDAPISLEDRAILPMKEKLERLNSARRVLRHRRGGATDAVTVAITWFDDLARAARLLRDDLEQREYRLELRGDFSSELYRQVQRELLLIREVENFLGKVGDRAPGDPDLLTYPC